MRGILQMDKEMKCVAGTLITNHWHVVVLNESTPYFDKAKFFPPVGRGSSFSPLRQKLGSVKKHTLPRLRTQTP